MGERGEVIIPGAIKKKCKIGRAVMIRDEDGRIIIEPSGVNSKDEEADALSGEPWKVEGETVNLEKFYHYSWINMAESTSQ